MCLRTQSCRYVGVQHRCRGANVQPDRQPLHMVSFRRRRAPASGAIVGPPPGRRSRRSSGCQASGDPASFRLVALDVARITIGDNTMVGAGAVVIKNLPANTLAVGNPARVIRRLM